MAIRYDKKLNQEINRVIKNFNQKIARLEKDQRELLPSKITKKDLKSSVYTRRELNRKLNGLKRFSKRGAEEIITTKGGVRTTQYELNELKRESARIKRNVTREINRLQTQSPKVFGKIQDTTFAQMGDTNYLNLLARKNALNKDIKNLSKEEFERYKKLVDKTGKSQEYMNSVFKENYFQMLTDLGYYFNYDKKKLDKLKEKMMKLKPNDFLKLFNEDKSIRAILDYYPIITNSFDAIDPADIKEDVTNLYDMLIENMDQMLQ